MIKIKAHRDFAEVTDKSDAYAILGNSMTDAATRNAFQEIPLEIRKSTQTIFDDLQHANAEGEKIINFLLNCQLTFHRAKIARKIISAGLPYHVRLHAMRNWMVSTVPKTVHDVDDDIFKAFDWGRPLVDPWSRGRATCSGAVAQ